MDGRTRDDCRFSGFLHFEDGKWAGFRESIAPRFNRGASDDRRIPDCSEMMHHFYRGK